MSLPDDELPIAEVGEWALEKHERLRKYVDITRPTRRKYTEKKYEGEYKGGATYIDLFCGPGRARIRETDEIIDGSPLVAFKSAAEGKCQFSEIHLADLNESYCDASVERIAAAGGHAIGYPGTAEETAQTIVAKLNPDGLHFAFLDPFNLEGLTFTTIKSLSKMRHMDLLLHVSVQDLQRNIDRYSALNESPLDSFAPGWRTEVDLNQAQASLRVSLMKYWRAKVEELGFLYRGVDPVTGSRNQRLYWLIFLAKSEFANNLWDKIRNISGQRDLLSRL
jgi:three-Cys-motif partner protein